MISDQLEVLWNLSFGDSTRILVRRLDSNFHFSSTQVQLRESIGSFFNDNGLNNPLIPQLMLANFLLSPPGLLQINNVDDYFPQWLASAYRELYEGVSITSSSTQNKSSQFTPNPTLNTPSSPEFGEFPSSLKELVSNRIHLNRLLGLSNLYYIDPEDREICSDLTTLRTSLAAAIDSCPENDLETLWSTDLGDRYWSLVRSGIQNEPLSSHDEAIKQATVTRLNPASQGGFGTPGAVNAFLVAMMYFLPGTMKVDDADQKIPSWLLANYKSIFAQAMSA
jgi:hypothetical protein